MANRHKARESALEVLYAWSCADKDDDMLEDLIQDRLRLANRKDMDREYLKACVEGVVKHHDHLDRLIESALHGRKLEHIGAVEWNILRLATWELSERLEVPYRVVINEALQLARTYADEPARGFINGVLDQLANRLRAAEKQAGQRHGKR